MLKKKNRLYFVLKTSCLKSWQTHFTVVSTQDLALRPCLSFITGKPQIKFFFFFRKPTVID
jgi:hypothetical protein